MDGNHTTSKKGVSLAFSTHNLALISIAFYVISMVAFEWGQSDLSILSSVGLYFCLAMCALDMLSNRRMIWDWYCTVLVVFGIVLAISYLYSPTKTLVKNTYLYRYVTTAVLVVCIYNELKTKEDFHFLINVFILAGACSAINVYATYGFANMATSLSRIGTELGNQNLVGMYCAFPIIFGIYKLFVLKTKKNRVFWVACIVICVPAVMFSGSRKAILMVVISLIAMLLIYSGNKRLIKRVMGICVILLTIYFVIEYVPAFSVIEDRFNDLITLATKGKSELTGDAHRLYYIETGIEEFLKSPIIGKGFCYSYFLFNTYTHNNYIELLLNNGLIGFITYYYIYARLMVTSMKKRIENRVFVTSIWMIMVAILICDVGMVTYYNRYVLILLTMCSRMLGLFKTSGFAYGEMDQ